jgi:hypothetical protein
LETVVDRDCSLDVVLDELELEALWRMLLLEEPFNFNFPPITRGLEDFAATTLDMVG